MYWDFVAIDGVIKNQLTLKQLRREANSQLRNDFQSSSSSRQWKWYGIEYGVTCVMFLETSAIMLVNIFCKLCTETDRLCGLVVRVLGCRSGSPGRFPVLPGKKIMGLERGPFSLVSTTEKLLDRKVAAPVYKTENTAVRIRHPDHLAPSIRKSWHSLLRQSAVARSV
jgi:hypothetical protein